MKSRNLLLLAALFAALQIQAWAQTNAANATNLVAVPAAPPHVNQAIVPVSRTGSITNRQAQVLARAKNGAGDYDIEFIGDSITQGWETAGKNVWADYYGKRKVINFGVSGDRTENVLWRFEKGQLEGVKAKVAVVMIGTNNSNKNKDGTEAFSDSDILGGVTAVVEGIRQRQPDTKILLLGIFPRGSAFNPQRGRLLEINQALARLDDGQHVFFTDFGSRFIENDGTISKEMMRDALHPGEKGYRIWAEAIEPKLKELLGEK